MMRSTSEVFSAVTGALLDVPAGVVLDLLDVDLEHVGHDDNLLLVRG